LIVLEEVLCAKLGWKIVKDKNNHHGRYGSIKETSIVKSLSLLRS